MISCCCVARAARSTWSWGNGGKHSSTPAPANVKPCCSRTKPKRSAEEAVVAVNLPPRRTGDMPDNGSAVLQDMAGIIECHVRDPIWLTVLLLHWAAIWMTRRSQIRRAFDELARLPSSRLLAHSSLYRSAPGGLTRISLISSTRWRRSKPHSPPMICSNALLEIEHCHGRVREYLNAPRTLDLDILMYDDLQCERPLPDPAASRACINGRLCCNRFWKLPRTAIFPGTAPLLNCWPACAGQQIEREQE